MLFTDANQWAVLALILIVRGAGQFSLDAMLTRGRG